MSGTIYKKGKGAVNVRLNKVLYVINKDKFIYEVGDIEFRSDGWVNIELNLVCGIDYINPDESNVQGYVDKSRFVESMQTEDLSCDILNESIKATLEYYEYKVVDKLPKIYK